MSALKRLLLVWSLIAIAVLSLVPLVGAQTSSRVYIPIALAVGLPDLLFVSNRSGNGEIYTSYANGSNQVRRTQNTLLENLPTWSPDGKSIMFFASEEGTNDAFDIYTMNYDGTNLKRLTSTPTSEVYPTWSPDGTKIAYTIRRGASGIGLMNADGTGQRLITATPVGTDDDPYTGFISWTPDSQSIIFTTINQQGQEIRSVSSDGIHEKILATVPGINYVSPPVPSPDGTKVAFSVLEPSITIYVVNIDGTSKTTLLQEANVVLYDVLSWSPSGTKLVFTSSYATGNSEISTINADGSDRKNITNTPNFDYDPTWSPDSTRIAYTSVRDGQFEIYVINSDGSGDTRLTDNPGWDSLLPQWRPTQ